MGKTRKSFRFNSVDIIRITKLCAQVRLSATDVVSLSLSCLESEVSRNPREISQICRSIRRANPFFYLTDKNPFRIKKQTPAKKVPPMAHTMRCEKTMIYMSKNDTKKGVVK